MATPSLSSVPDSAPLEADVLVVGAFAGDPGEVTTTVDLGELGPVADAHLANIGFKGKVGEVALLPGPARGGHGLAIAGLGPRTSAGTAELRRAAGAVARRIGHYRWAVSDLHRALDDPGGAGAVAEGFALGFYRFDSYRSDPPSRRLERIGLRGASQDEIDRATVVAEAVTTARDLINEPASTLTPAALAERAVAVAGSRGLHCVVLDETELKRQGFGGILGVGQGSSLPPRLITLRYRPASPSGRVAIIGKGITFDSGGLTLKDGKSMETMKTDMSGAAAVFATMTALERLGLDIEVTGYIPAAENMPGGSAIKPGDVITHFGGKTTEVLNTDAEGRLVLADVLAAASTREPDAIVDVATLTGSIVVALGKKMSGLFTNDDALKREVLAAATRAGEKIWPMPLVDEYQKELESEIADQKNVGSRYGGAIIAALFLREFVAPRIPWAHLDIAGTARSDSETEDLAKGGTGVATRTLIRWLEARAM